MNITFQPLEFQNRRQPVTPPVPLEPAQLPEQVPGQPQPQLPGQPQQEGSQKVETPAEGQSGKQLAEGGAGVMQGMMSAPLPEPMPEVASAAVAVAIAGESMQAAR